MHTPEQQLPTDGHACPFGVQVDPPHIPCVHTFEQQSLARMQLAPVAPQLWLHLP
jgi:hypothetical protein